MSKYLHEKLSYRVVGALYAVHNALGLGLLESAYEGALVIELEELGLAFRQVTFFSLTPGAGSPDYLKITQERFDTPQARSMYSRRMGAVEPVFGDISGTKHLNRFTLRGMKKVNTQWRLFCTVHNIGKLQGCL